MDAIQVTKNTKAFGVERHPIWIFDERVWKIGMFKSSASIFLK